MRRYFDEYRGLRDSTGHVEPLPGTASARDVGRLVKDDARWMRERGYAPARARSLDARSVAHHAGRKLFAALGSRSERLPGSVQSAISLEGRGGAERHAGDVEAPRGVEVGSSRGATPYDEVLRVSREGPAPLLDPVTGMADRGRLHIAVVIPPFQRGSGGHGTIFTLLSRLEGMGHDLLGLAARSRGLHGAHRGRRAAPPRRPPSSRLCARPSCRASASGTAPTSS